MDLENHNKENTSVNQKMDIIKNLIFKKIFKKNIAIVR